MDNGDVSSTTRVRNWVVTINNWTDDDQEGLRKLDYRYLVFGREVGEEGTPHLQGYVEFSTSVRFNRVKELIPRGYLDRRRGTAKQASDYCKKDGDFEEYGTLGGAQGHRTDMDSIKEIIDNGGTLTDIRDEFYGAYIRYQRSITRDLFAQASQSLRLGLNVKVYWGRTGSGKTRAAWEETGEKFILRRGNTGYWFDGYRGQDLLIIDEFRSGTPYANLLAMLDIYPYGCDTKTEGVHWACWKRVIITSPIHPDNWYPNLDEDRGQLNRRIHEIKEFE